MNNIAVVDVLLYGERIGTLTRLPGDRILFAFTEAYIADLDRATLSLSFKDTLGNLITDVRPTQTRLPVFFANLLPEGTMRDYLAARAQVKPEREFFLLATLGQDLPGALEIRPADGAMPLDESLHTADTEAEAPPETALHFSLAGVQLKFSALKNARGGLTIPVDGVGGSWIVKLPSTQFPRVPENEFAMMELARRVGISVPDTALVPISEISGLPSGISVAGSHAYAIKRFDREPNNTRVHIEDFAQVFGVYPERKYDRASYRNIAEVIWTEMGGAGIVEFLRRLVFNVLTPFESRPMTKYAHPESEGFGKRLARLRKSAGYTQEQLASELGISRRRIAYYEAESDHPPANLLADLARILNIPVEQFLSSGPVTRKTRTTLSPRLERRLKQIERLSAKPKQQLLSIIDTFIEAEQNRNGSRS